jgi:hypothetical protein
MKWALLMLWPLTEMLNASACYAKTKSLLKDFPERQFFPIDYLKLIFNEG